MQGDDQAETIKGLMKLASLIEKRSHVESDRTRNLRNLKKELD